MKKVKVTLFYILIFIFTININVFAENINKPDIKGKYAITVDIQTGEIIYDKYIDSLAYPASTTKLMTGLLLAENKSKTDLLKYTKGAKSQPAYSLGLNVHPIEIGENMTSEDAMDALLLYSGNDIAYMIGDNVGGSAKAFTNLMNQKAEQIGMKNSHFITSNGLHDINHYTTAYDLSLLGRKAFENSWIRETMNKKTSIITTSKVSKMTIKNRNKLLEKDGCIGGKTGYTSKAGRCLAAVYERNGRKIIGVVMKSIYDKNDVSVFNDMEKIINWSYNTKKTVLYPKNSILKTVKVDFKPFSFLSIKKTLEIPLTIHHDITYYDNEVNKGEKREIYNIKPLNILDLFLSKDKRVGTVTLKVRNSTQTYDLYIKN